MRPDLPKEILCTHFKGQFSPPLNNRLTVHVCTINSYKLKKQSACTDPFFFSLSDIYECLGGSLNVPFCLDKQTTGKELPCGW